MTTTNSKRRSANQSAWTTLSPGTRVAIVKLAPEGSEAARYASEVVTRREPGGWVIVRAIFTYRQVDLDGLSFVPGDVLLEWFSPEQPFNAFAVFSPQGDFRGWYANVAHPARITMPGNDDAEPVLVWHDLYLDLVGLPDGRWTLRDEDELRQSSLDARDPALLARIEAAAAEMQRRFVTEEVPFVDQGELRALLDRAEVPSNSQ